MNVEYYTDSEQNDYVIVRNTSSRGNQSYHCPMHPGSDVETAAHDLQYAEAELRKLTSFLTGGTKAMPKVLQQMADARQKRTDAKTKLMAEVIKQWEIANV